MAAIIAFIRKEPTAIAAIVTAVIALAASFGLKLTADQTGTLMALVALIVGFVVRSQVTPTATVPPVPVPPPTLVTGPFTHPTPPPNKSDPRLIGYIEQGQGPVVPPPPVPPTPPPAP